MIEFKKGLTFRVNCQLIKKLAMGSYWTLVQEPEERPNVPLHKETAVFVKLIDFVIPKKIRMHNSIYFSQQSIERYLERNYIELTNEFAPTEGYPEKVDKRVYDIHTYQPLEAEIPNYARNVKVTLDMARDILTSKKPHSAYMIKYGISKSTVAKVRREADKWRERGEQEWNI